MEKLFSRTPIARSSRQVFLIAFCLVRDSSKCVFVQNYRQVSWRNDTLRYGRRGLITPLSGISFRLAAQTFSSQSALTHGEGFCRSRFLDLKHAVTFPFQNGLHQQEQPWAKRRWSVHGRDRVWRRKRWRRRRRTYGAMRLRSEGFGEVVALFVAETWNSSAPKFSKAHAYNFCHNIALERQTTALLRRCKSRSRTPSFCSRGRIFAPQLLWTEFSLISAEKSQTLQKHFRNPRVDFRQDAFKYSKKL